MYGIATCARYHRDDTLFPCCVGLDTAEILRTTQTQGMLQVPDPTGYKGIVIAKQRADHPATDEPVVYAFAKIAHRRRPVVSTEVVLGLAEEKDRATRYSKAATRFHVVRATRFGVLRKVVT